MEGAEKYTDSTDFLERLDVVKPKVDYTKGKGDNQVQIIVGELAAYGPRGGEHD